MERYEKYKDSGIAWLGEIPEHWTAYRLKTLIPSCLNGVWGDNPDNSKNDIVCIRVADFDMDNLAVSTEKLTLRNIDLQKNELRLLALDDLLIEKSGGGEKTPVGRVIQNSLNQPAVSSNFIGKLILNEKLGISRYIAYLFYSLYAIGLNTRSIKQTTGIQNLDVDSYLNEFIELPPLEEQKAIAAYLDHKTAEIDELIAQKERLIELYEEEKTAIINQAVTKGINPDIKLKPSGIDWLGDIPEHWEVIKLRYLFEIRKRIAGELGFDILSITQRGIKVKNIDSKDGQISSDYSKYQIVEKGDFAMNNMDLLTGFVDIAKQKGVTSPDYRVFTLIDPCSCDQFFLYLLQIGYIRKIFYGFGRGAALFGRWRFPTDEFNNFCFPYPPLEEQKAIAKYIEKETALIDAKIAKTKRIIELQKEYRTALISEAVTGKIKVPQMNKMELTL